MTGGFAMRSSVRCSPVESVQTSVATDCGFSTPMPLDGVNVSVAEEPNPFQENAIDSSLPTE